MPTTDTVTIEVVGFNVAAEHMWTVGAITADATGQAVTTFQIDLINIARELAKSHIDSGATIGSIAALTKDGEGVTAPSMLIFDGNNIWADTGAGGDVVFGEFGGEGTADPQARLQEFGFFHEGSGEFIANPFMIPALDAVSPKFVEAMTLIAQIGDQFPAGLPQSISSKITQLRSRLYSLSRAMGDIQVLTGGSFGILRGGVLRASRALGDMNAIMKGGIASLGRLENRALGGAASGLGRSSLSVGNYGAASSRIYNRFAGKGFGMSIRRLSVVR